MADARPGYAICPACTAEVLRVVDDRGATHDLDTTLPTWVVIGHAKAGVPRVRRSAGYVVHQCARRDTATHVP